MILLKRAGTLCLIALSIGIAFCCLLNTPAFAQQFEFKGKRSKQRIAFQMVKNLVIVPLLINGTGPFNFILDTGASPLIITDPTIIEGLDLKNLRRTKINGLGKGHEIDALLTSDIYVQLGKATMANMPTAILEGDLLGLSNYLGVKIHGLIGYYFFRSFLVTINYSSKTLIFRENNGKRKIKGEKTAIELINNKPYTTVGLTLSNLGAIKAKVVVDNGAGHALSLETYKDTPFPPPEKSIDANLGNGLSGPISGKVGRVESLEIGNHSFKNVISSFPVYDDAAAKVFLANRNGNLGADILSRFNITFDYEHEAMYLQKNKNFKLPFEHDMSGLEVFADNSEKKRFFVVRIEPGSPGEQAGIQTNDEILAINFDNTQKMSLDQVTKLFRYPDGKTLFLTINRNGELTYKLLKLKRRI